MIEIITLSEDTSKEELLNLAPFIDIPGNYGSSFYRFEWEREWRVVGDIYFTPSDVAFLIIPGEKHALARTFFNDAEIEHLGTNYTCAFYDPLTGKHSE